MQKIIFVLLMSCTLSFALAQQRTITGTVRDEQGAAVGGASFIVKGSTDGGKTKEDGSFSIIINGDRAILEFSAVGYQAKEIAVLDKTILDIVLERSNNQMEEVIVTGYGKTSRRFNPNSVASVAIDKLQNRPVGSIEGLLQGLVPGLLVQNGSGAPGGRSSISIRGLSNFSASANSNVVSTPLFIIDGVPQDQDAFNPSDPRQAITSVLAGLNPFDLESIDVLKDAAATAIYGSRGANGVIIITTKRGKIGKPIVSINAQYGHSYYPELRKTFGGRAERQFKVDLYNQYKSSKVGGGFTEMPIELSDSLNGYYNNSTNWQKLLFNTANITDINVGVSGANENASYRVGASYYNEDGIVLGSGFKRYSLLYTGVFNPTSKLTITARANLSQKDASLKRGDTYGAVGLGNSFASSFQPGPSSQYTYAYLEAYQKGVNVDLTRNIAAQLEASYDFTDFLNLTSRASANYEFYRTRSFNPSAANTDGKASASYYSQEKVDLLSETFLRLHNVFQETHTVDFVVGNTINTNKKDNIYGAGTGGPSDAQQVIQGYPQSNIILGTNNITYGLLSYYGRLSYDFRHKYILQGILRADASSKFGKDNQWGYFPSASAAWLLSTEKFFKDNVGDWFSFAKIRASVGKAGEQYQNDYLALGAYNTGAGIDNNGRPVPNLNTYNGVPILAPNYAGGNGIPIPTLTWQTSKEYTLGLEMEFFKGRITTVIERYNKDKDGFLFNDPLNSTSGYASRFINSGSVRNSGFDFSLTVYVTRPENNFQYNFTYNGSTNKNVLTKLPDFGRSVTRSGYAAGDPYLQIGKPLNGFYLLKYLGVYATDADVPYNPYTGGKLRPYGLGFTSQDPYKAGDIMLYDANGDYIIQTVGNDDKVYMGDPNPKFFGGMSHNFTYKLKNNSSIQIGLLFSYSVGAKVYNSVLADRIKSVSWTSSNNVNYPGGQRNLLDVSDIDYWTPDHINAKYPALNPWRYYATSSYDFIGNYDTNTSLFLEDGSFVRLNNINIGYDFSPAFLHRIKARRLRVFAGMDNLFIIKKYSGVDPENVNDYGYDRGDGYPIPKKFNMGVNFQF